MIGSFQLCVGVPERGGQSRPVLETPGSEKLAKAVELFTLKGWSHTEHNRNLDGLKPETSLDGVSNFRSVDLRTSTMDV